MKCNQHWTTWSLFTVLFVLSSLHPVPAGAVPPVSFALHKDHPTGSYPYWPTIGDINGDHKPDVVVGNLNSSTVSVLLGDGFGGFVAAADVLTGVNPYDTALADLNGDGKLDLAVANVSSGTTSVRLGDGAGGFGPAAEYPSAAPASAAFADLNGDANLDLVVLNSNCGGGVHSVSIRLGMGDGSFGPRNDINVDGCPGIRLPAIVDLDRDGKLDLVVCDWFGNLRVLFGDGAGGFPSNVGLGTPGQISGGDVGDFNGDGRLDLVASSTYSPQFFVWLSNGGRTFGPRTPYPSATRGACGVADLNRDGKLDVVTSADFVAVALGNGDGTFGPPTTFPVDGTCGTMIIGDVDVDGRPDIVTGNASSNTISVLLNASGTTVSPQPPTTCIAPSHPCVEVPVTISRTDATPVRGFSVDVQLSGNLALCPPSIVQGSYLSGIGATTFQTINNGGGSYTVDCAILGLPCGATAPSGTLFTLHLGSAASTGTGTVTVTGVALRDCSNGPVAGYPGPPASITIDNQVPGVVALSAAQQTSGNDGDGTTKINLSWTGTVTVGDSVLIYRAGYGHYPEYDMGGAVPATPGYPPASTWAPAGYALGPGASFTDEVAARDFWYHVAFVKDPCGNVSAVSNQTGGTLNYFLGDVSDGTTICQGDNLVSGEDVSFLGAHYGITLADPDPLGCLDVGPTTDHSVNARPLTDDRLNFEDLILFAINYGQVSLPQARAVPVAAGHDELSLEAPAKVSAGETFSVTLRLNGAGDLQGISTQLGWDAAVAELLSVEAGALVTSQGGVVFSSGSGTVDAALLGAGRTLVGEGALATLMFRARASGNPKVAIENADARDAANRSVALTGGQPQAPQATAFAPVTPNPFTRTTTLSFSLSQGGPVELAIFSVDGRRVRTLVKEAREAGIYRLSWDGADEAGRAVSAGLFYARLLTSQGRFNRTLVRVK